MLKTMHNIISMLAGTSLDYESCGVILVKYAGHHTVVDYPVLKQEVLSVFTVLCVKIC